MGLALVAALSLSSTLMAWAWGALTPSFGVNLAVYLLQARTEQAELSRPTLTDPLRQFQWAFPVVCVWCISINVLIGIFMAGFPATLPACSLVLAAFSLLLGVRVAVHLCMADSHLARGVFSWSWMSTVVAAVSAYAAADRHAGAGSDPLVTNVSEWAMLCWTFMYFLGGLLGRIIDIEPKHRHGVIFVTTALWASRRVAGSAFGSPWESMMVMAAQIVGDRLGRRQVSMLDEWYALEHAD